MGYSLKRNFFYHLIELILDASEELKNDRIEKSIYINILSHPLVKNTIFEDSEKNRIAVEYLIKLIRNTYINAHDFISQNITRQK